MKLALMKFNFTGPWLLIALSRQDSAAEKGCHHAGNSRVNHRFSYSLRQPARLG